MGQTKNTGAASVPLIGILGWEQGNADTLGQLEQIPGDIAHPHTFDFPVIYRRVDGACYETVVVRPNEGTLSANIAAARKLQAEGVRAVMTNCGFNAVYQRQLADALDVPLFASSLLQVPLVWRMLARGKAVGVLTADRQYLSERHLRAVGITDDIPLQIRGIEHTGEFARIRRDPTASLDPATFVQQVVDEGRALARDRPEVGALVLECTDLPPASARLRRELNLPVFDIVTLTRWVHQALSADLWPGTVG